MDGLGHVLRAAHTDSAGDAAVAPYGKVLLHAMKGNEKRVDV